MSGGVDSTVTAALLLEAGYQVIGLTMLIWDPRIPVDSPIRSGCFGPGEAEDLARARAMAETLGIAHRAIRLTDAYRREVLDWYRSQYLAGRTPNPCALCNPRMKFDILPREARAQGIAFDAFATGHYARIVAPEAPGSTYRLLRGRDPDKDQSYFLARLSQAQLAETLLPLGDLTKHAVREKARALGWASLAESPESQDFFEGEDISALFPAGEGTHPGPILDTDGRRIGTHRGIIYYTVGQRQGLGVATGSKCYVRRICAQTNTIVVASRAETLASGCRIRDPHWVAGTPPPPGMRCRLQLRYRHAGVAGTITPQAPDLWEAQFDEPQFAVAPGQMAVCYADDEVLGGGWID